MNNNEKFILEAEKRFKKTCKLTCDVASYPLPESSLNVETNKDKAKEFSEVFTPLWLVDQMVGQVKFSGADTSTLDLCAGYGQFSIRLMRYMNNTYPDWNVSKFIKDSHAFSELQLSSCYKLMNVFGNKITLFIGDSTHLNKLPINARGLWCYIENYGYWVCLTKTVQGILSPNGIKEKPCSEARFVSSIESIVKGLNETYINMKDFLNQLTNSKLRLELIDQLNERVKDGVKIVPPNLVSEMLDKVEDLEKKSILVLYNCEIVEQLVAKKKIDPKNITFGDTFSASMKSDAMKKMYGVETISFGSEMTFLHSTFKGRKFDVCLSNPPYNRGLDLKILQTLMGKGTVDSSIAKEFVWVHPSTWLLDQKGKTNLYGNIKALLANKVKSVKLFNGNTIFSISLMLPCLITHINIEYNSPKTKVKFFDEEFDVSDLDDITKFGKSWLPIVKPFVAKIEKFISTNGEAWSHNTRTIEPSKEYCQLAAIRGHESYDTVSMVKDDFYTMTVDINTCRGIRQPNLNRPGNPTPTFGFKTAAERDNFLYYVNTDFARFCLAIYKNNSNLAVGEMELIPWLDFTQAWDDKKLFDHFDINKDTQDYIRKFLPDYYNIRK